MATADDVNMAAFSTLLPSLLAGHRGEFVLMRDGEKIGLFPTYAEATNSGYERFGLEQFFVEQVLPPDELAGITRFVVL